MGGLRPADESFVLSLDPPLCSVEWQYLFRRKVEKPQISCLYRTTNVRGRRDFEEGEGAGFNDESSEVGVLYKEYLKL